MTDFDPERELRLQRRNKIVCMTLLAFCALMFFVTIAKMTL